MSSSLQAALAELAQLEAAIPIVRASQYMTICGFTVLLYDYLLTLSAEIEVIWKSNRSTISLIFLANRYLVPLIYAVDIYDRLGLAKHPSVLIWIWVEAYLMIFSFMSLHALVAMRVHALHGGGKRLKVVLWICGSLYASATVTTLAVALWVRNDDLAPAPFFNVCFEHIASFLWTVWIPSIAFELLLFVLTIWKAMDEARRHVYSPISSILYRDGILYFISISGCSVFSMCVWLFGTPIMVGLAKYWAFAFANVAAARLVLNLKTHARALHAARTAASSSFGHDPLDFDPFGGGEYIDLARFPTAALGTLYPTRTYANFEAL